MPSAAPVPPPARRVIPWILLGLLGLGAVAAAAIGQVRSPSAATAPAGSSAAQWVATLLATTTDAGTAHFTYSHVTTSPDPQLRGSITGSGEVDFTAGSVQVTEVEQQTEIVPAGGLLQPRAGQPQNVVEPARGVARKVRNVTKMVGVGTAMYQNVFGNRWVRMGITRDPHAQLGLQLAANASVALAGLDGVQPVASVRKLGPATLDGVATTRYLVTDHAPQPCAGSDQATSAALERLERQNPTTVWVDGRGRLVQARYSISTAGSLPKGPTALFAPLGPATTTATLTFTQFSAPVTITAPSTAITPGGSATGFAIGHACGT